jgi:hypothetical protein
MRLSRYQSTLHQGGRFNDTIAIDARILSRSTTSKTDRGIVVIGVTVLNQNADPVLGGEWTLMVRREG